MGVSKVDNRTINIRRDEGIVRQRLVVTMQLPVTGAAAPARMVEETKSERDSAIGTGRR